MPLFAGFIIFISQIGLYIIYLYMGLFGVGYHPAVDIGEGKELGILNTPTVG